MRTRIVKLQNGKYALQVRKFWQWRGVLSNGILEPRNDYFGLMRNLCWNRCWCDTKEEAEKRKEVMLNGART